MASPARTDVSASKPSAQIRHAQDLVRSLLVEDDLLDNSLMLELVSERLCDLESELGALAGKQEMFELVMQS